MSIKGNKGAEMKDHCQVLENFLADELSLTVAIGGKPNSFSSAQRLANGLELSGLVATLCRTSTVKTFRP